MDNYSEIRLLKKRKLGGLKIIFSRFGITMLLILLELGVLLYMYEWFYEYVRMFAALQIVFSIGMILYLFNSKMESSVKLTWLYLIMLFPVPATIMLWFSRRDVGHRIVKWRSNQLLDESKQMIEQDQHTIQQKDLVESGTDDLCRYLNHSGKFPIYENTDVTYCNSGEAKFEHLLQELKKAESFIFLEYFIIDEGYMWGNILGILAEKAKQGVDVRVLYDGMCEVSLLTHDYPKRMEKLGISCKPFTPIMPFISTQYNYRDHRKIAIIDGNVAFTGGVNLADEYINKKQRFGHWKDCAVMVKGEAVKSFTLMFLQMWNLDEKEIGWDEVQVASEPVQGSGYVMPYADSPLDDYKVGENVYLDILYRAKSYVYIMTPYLIPDNELESALKYAAQRGVDVKLILPGCPDKKTAFALAKSYYKVLVEAGVQIYEYEPGFVHAKLVVSDNEKAVVGTINLDYRSLYHNFECATYLYKTDCIKDIYEDYQNTLKQCRQVTQESIRNEKIGYKLLGGILKIYETLM